MTGEAASVLVTTGIDALIAILPLAALLLVLQRVLLKLPRVDVARVLLGLAMAAGGLFLFLLGVAVAYIPFGRALGEALATVEATWLVMAIGLVLGLLTALGEPAVRILADQVEDASAGSIRRSMVLAAIAVGVAASVAIGLLRIMLGIPLLYILAPGYALVLVLIWLSYRDFVAIAIDAGGVATGPLVNTFLLAVALGASAGFGDESPVVSGLGLAALISVAPIISVLILGVLIRRKQPLREEQK
ncbi:MAG: DUF1538 domain-containing protein [Bauldia sp.]